MSVRPRILLTPGDVAGIGPEIIARAWPALLERGIPVVVGDVEIMRKALALIRSDVVVKPVLNVAAASPNPGVLPVIQATEQEVAQISPGKITAAGGRAAYDFLCRAIDLALAGDADAIVTGPLHKEGLNAAGLNYPGHTEILAERTETREYAMVLWGNNVAVAHVTLHNALRDVFAKLNTGAILEKARLLGRLLPRLIGRQPRIAIAALNPHAGDGGLFGDEEARLIAPAVKAAQAEGIDASGPWPSDTLFIKAMRGEFDGVVAMYHDQGHIPMKLRCGWDLVNITAGLPIVRTSVAHGTAHDIAGRGIADAGSLITAADAACRLAALP